MVKITLVEDEAPKAKITVQHSIEDFDPIIKKAAEKYKIDPLLLKAQMLVESGGNARIQGPEVGDKKERAGGLFQLMPGTAKDLGVTDVFDPEQNIDAGARYLRMQMDHPSAAGDLPTGLMFYHGGKDPKNWGTQSFAYPAKVLQKYRELGGREMDPALPKANFATRALSAALPFDLMSRTAIGKGPDLSQGLSGPEANRPVGAKLKEWFGSVSPERDRFKKAQANYADANPLLSIGADVVGGLPASIAMGAGINAGLGGLAKMAPESVAPMLNFVAGQAGRGMPMTGEGASLATRALSGATNGALQGAVQGGANAFLHEGQSNLDGAKTGAVVGGAIGGALPLLGAGLNRIFFGKRLHPATAQLGQEAQAGVEAKPGMPLEEGFDSASGKLTQPLQTFGATPGRPKIPLTADLDQINQLSLDPKQFSREVGSLIDETAPFTVAKGQLPEARKVVGAKFDKAAEELHAAIDKPFLQGLNTLLTEAQGDANLVTELNKLPTIKKLLQRFAYAAAMEDGMLAGKEYQELVRQGDKPGLISKLIKSTNPTVAEFGSNLRTLLDEAVDRGAVERIQTALARGDNASAEKTLKAFLLLQEARQQWKMIRPIEAALDPITQEILPAKLYAGAEKVGGKLEQLARTGIAFDPANKAPHVPMSMPYTAVAAGTGAAIQDPVTTGQAALALGLANKLGRGAQHLVRKLPGYESALLARSRTFGPGPLQTALRTVGLPAGVTAATSRNPLLQEQELGQR